MHEEPDRTIALYTQSFADASGIGAAAFEFATRSFLTEAPCRFCAACGLCDYVTAHTYGSFEAERWNGLFVYYCPLSLTFASAVVFDGRRAAYALVTGPVVMGQLEDIQSEDTAAMRDVIAALPQRTPAQMNGLSRTLWSSAMFLSDRGLSQAEESNQTQARLHNTLYEVSSQMRDTLGAPYPLEIEQRLQRMIVQGDKQGARELINQLLGTLYFNTTGDFSLIRERARELVVLFSRAAAEGGADVRKIFGQNRNLQAEIDGLDSLDQLSEYLTSIFYRFVGYVFDFGRFEHADTLHKAINYLRENLSAKVTLEDVAAHVRLSRSYLSMLFKAELGSTFTDYLNNMRIEKSKELLQDPALSLADIAALIGYSDQSYFTKKFVQLVGMSPGRYRKKRGQQEKDEESCPD